MERFWEPRGSPKTNKKIDQKGYQNLAFFKRPPGSLPGEPRGLKRVPKPAIFSVKSDPADANRARGKNVDFEKEETRKTKLGSRFLQTGVQEPEP